MAIIYAPYIEGTIPAFGPTLSVPYEMNRGVSLDQVVKFVVKIMDLNNKVVGYIETQGWEEKVENEILRKVAILPLEFDMSKLELVPNGKPLDDGQYYKIQLAYSDEGVENSKLVYSSIGIGKYFGTTNPTLSKTENDLIKYQHDSEQLYSLNIIGSKELFITPEMKPTVGINIMNITGDTVVIEGVTLNGYITNTVSLDSGESELGDKLQILELGTDNEHMYLIGQNKIDILVKGEELEANQSLCIKFNPKVSSFKTTLQESKTDTIGGKYPIFYRNGTLGYKEFPINGLISYHMDENETFMSKDDLGLDNETNLPTHNLVEYNIEAERKFRNAVLDWLNNGEVKLFKSPTEGKYLVRLMNVSLSPEDKLSRMLYSFSATAYEVGEVNYTNLIKYGFLTKPEGVDFIVE